MIPAMANFIRPDNFCLLRRRGCDSGPGTAPPDLPHPRLLSETPAGRHVVPRPAGSAQVSRLRSASRPPGSRAWFAGPGSQARPGPARMAAATRRLS